MTRILDIAFTVPAMAGAIVMPLADLAVSADLALVAGALVDAVLAVEALGVVASDLAAASGMIHFSITLMFAK